MGRWKAAALPNASVLCVFTGASAILTAAAVVFAFSSLRLLCLLFAFMCSELSKKSVEH